MSDTVLKLELPIKTVSEANRRDHWAEKHRRAVNQRQEVWAEWLRAATGSKVRLQLPLTVRLTRIGPKLLDDDNLRSAFKAIRDVIARLIGADDGDLRLRFEYAQEAVGKRSYAVRIEVLS